MSPAGRVQGSFPELGTGSRNYGGNFLRYPRPLATPRCSFCSLPVQFEIRDSCRKETRVKGHPYTRSRCSPFLWIENTDPGSSVSVDVCGKRTGRVWRRQGEPGLDILVGWEKKLGISRFRWPFESWMGDKYVGVRVSTTSNSGDSYSVQSYPRALHPFLVSISAYIFRR